MILHKSQCEEYQDWMTVHATCLQVCLHLVSKQLHIEPTHATTENALETVPKLEVLEAPATSNFLNSI